MSHVTEIPEYQPCDVCRDVTPGGAPPAVVDAKTRYGPWAYLCQGHWKTLGASYPHTGTGKAQLLVKDTRGTERR